MIAKVLVPLWLFLQTDLLCFEHNVHQLNGAYSVSWLEVINGIPNHGLVCFVCYSSFSVYLLCLG